MKYKTYFGHSCAVCVILLWPEAVLTAKSAKDIWLKAGTVVGPF